jgi:putative lipoprotein
VPPGITVTLRFEDGRIGGKAGCNSYGAPVRAGLGTLMVGPVMSTKMACGPDDMVVEARFLEILAGIDRFQSDPSGDLVLEGPAGRIVAGP